MAERLSRSRSRRRSLALCAPLLLGWATAATAAPDPAEEAAQLIQRLRSGSPGERIRTLERLTELGEAARRPLERALGDLDPDVRLHVLHLLYAPEGELERQLRQIVDGRPHQPGASYPLALRAYRELVGEASPILRDQLLRVARRAAPRGQERLTIVALELWRACLLSEGKPRVRDGQLLGELFSFELGAAGDSLLDALGALPPKQRLAALRTPLSRLEGLPLARAARALGEVAAVDQAAEGRALLRPLLGARDARVRLAALRSWGLLAHQVADDSLPIVRLTLDPHPEVAREALRQAGDWRLVVAREAAERLANDDQRPRRVRAEAVRTLGLLGEPVSGKLLLALCVGKDRELSLLASWALGALRAPEAARLLTDQIRQGEAAEPLLFNGLARLGGDAGRNALRIFQRLPEQIPGDEDQRSLVEERVQRALAAGARLDHPKAAADLCAFLEQLPRRRGYPSERSYEVACEALAERGDSEAARLLLEHLEQPSTFFYLEELLEGVGRLGLPGGEGRHERELERLAEISRHGQARGLGTNRARQLAARALTRAAPAMARGVLAPQVTSMRGANEVQHAMARCLGLLGAPEFVLERALPVSQRRLRDARGAERVTALNEVGIDQLYAGQFSDALISFQRIRWVKPNEWYAAFNAACALAHLGRKDDALRLLRRAIRFGSKDITHLRFDHDLASLRDDPRFARLVAQVRLARETNLAIPVWPLPRQPQ